MVGVWRAAYCRPIVPSGSSRVPAGDASRDAFSFSASAPLTWPSSPGAEEMTCSQTTPSFAASRYSACMLPLV
jgi:hypothetical protein